MTSPSRLGFLLIVFVTILWGVNWPVLKLGLNEIPPFTFRALIVPTGGLLLIGLAKLGRFPLAVRRDRWGSLALLAFFNVTGWNVASAFGIGFMESGRASIIAFTMPVWAALIGVFFLNQRLGARTALALVLGIAGIAVLLGGDIAAFDKAPLGPIFMLAAAMLWAAGTVYQKKIDWAMPVLTLSAWQLLLGGAPIVLCALLFESPDWAALTPSAIGAVAYNIVGPLSLCYYAWFKIVELYPATAAGISVLMVPVIGVASAALALGEPFGLTEIAALVFVGSAIGLVLFAPKAPGTDAAYKSP